MGLAAHLISFTSHPGLIVPAQAQVLVNGLPAARVTDTHVCLFPPLAGPHPPNTIRQGSSTVLIGGLPAARVGDLTDCGASITTGSANVLIGG
ncbi:PAAR domain-containing protein [Sphaerotilaceae bacterium SBD11-9]